MVLTNERAWREYLKGATKATGRFSGLLTRFSTHLHPVVGRGCSLDDVVFINIEVAVREQDEAAIVERLTACMATEAVLDTMEFSIMARDE